MLNTHGMTMKGIRKASGETRDYRDDSWYDEVFYDKARGEVWTVFHHSLGHNSWTEYHNANVVKVCETSRHMTMQAIADAIHAAVTELRWC